MPPAIRVENLSKRYRIGRASAPGSYRTLRESLSEGASSLVRRFRGLEAGGPTEEFWALRGVDFEVRPGEVVGVIGRNGAGKSTLLKILSRITEPTEGRVRIRGRVGSLLEVGTGFHPELTGRENIFLNGAILGMTRREVARNFDAIVAFSEIEKFIDTPVKRYSSGMYVRLAFAVAAHLEPEILIVDEVLAVGDAAFQKKCLGKMGQVAHEGRTILFVSHNNAAISQLTTGCILLDRGSIVAAGPTQSVLDEYTRLAKGSARRSYDVRGLPRVYPQFKRQVEFLELGLRDSDTGMIAADEPLALQIKVRNKGLCDRLRFSFTIHRIDGTPIGNTFGEEVDIARVVGEESYAVVLKDHRLAPGHYYLCIAAGVGNHLGDCTEYDYLADVVHFEIMPEIGESGVRATWYGGWGSVRFDVPTIERIEDRVIAS